jgi:hypothetical protein
MFHNDSVFVWLKDAFSMQGHAWLSAQQLLPQMPYAAAMLAAP